MGLQQFTENLLTDIGQIFGAQEGGTMASITGFFLLAGAFVLLLFAISALLGMKRRSDAAKDPGFDRLSGVLGRLERVERTLNDFKTEVLRSAEYTKGEIGFLRQEIQDIKALVQGEELLEREQTAQAAVPLEAEQYPQEQYPEEEEPQPEPQLAAQPEAVVEAKDVQKPAPLAEKLSKTRKGFFEKIKDLFSTKSELDQGMLEELEAQLISADLGIKTASSLISDVTQDLKSGEPIDQAGLVALLKIKILNILEKGAQLDPSIVPKKKDQDPLVVMIVGVNGAGKTTTCAKLASAWKESGAKVLLVAADTFRAAAVEQLSEWGQRLDVSVEKGAQGVKPATVVYDAMQRAKAENYDVVLIDTAGRLHTKSNLMEELSGIKNSLQKHQNSAPHETLLVLDGSTGQNALSQAKEFNEAVTLSGVVITKLDGTPRGGIVVAIKNEFQIPICYIGVGESKNDLRPFAAREFVEALFEGQDSEANGQKTALSAHAETRRRRRKDTSEYFGQ